MVENVLFFMSLPPHLLSALGVCVSCAPEAPQKVGVLAQPIFLLKIKKNGEKEEFSLRKKNTANFSLLR